MRRVLATTFVAVLAGVGLAVVPTTAAYGGDPLLEVDLVSPVEPLTFRLEIDDTAGCDEGTFSVSTVEANGNAVTPLAVVADPTNPNAGYVVLPSATPAGVLEFVANCVEGATEWGSPGDIEWGALAVTKVVEGPAPADAAFVVNVACTEKLMESTEYGGPGVAGLVGEYDIDLEFDATGGTKYVYFDDASECLITEPVNGGATTTTIVPDEILNDEPTSYASTVTNTYAPALQPTFTG